MTSDQWITIITGILEAGGIGVFLFFLIRGLRNQIRSLQKTIDTQKQTLEVMEKRISETEKIGEIYKNLLNDLPRDLENYKSLIAKTKDEMISELEKANKTNRWVGSRLHFKLVNMIYPFKV